MFRKYSTKVDALVYALSEKDLAQFNVSSIAKQLKASKFTGKANEIRMLYGTDEHTVVGVMGIGKDGSMNSVRSASAKMIQSLKSTFKKHDISVTFNPGNEVNSQALAEGAHLGSFEYTQTKTILDSSGSLKFKLSNDKSTKDWRKGQIYASAQNLARLLAELPANHMTPSLFCDKAQEIFNNETSVKVNVHDYAWAKKQGMGSFLSVTHGSDEPCRFLELVFKNNNQDSAFHALVGKGVTFDSGFFIKWVLICRWNLY
jgi:aminopeptidase